MLMRMTLRFVNVRMSMGDILGHIGFVLVAVMESVRVAMAVKNARVHMLVRMFFREVQPDTGPHERRDRKKTRSEWFV